MKQENPNLLKRLLTIMVFDHASLNITFPVLTLLFFDTNSRLFSPETSHAVRSLFYGLCVAIPHVVVIFAAPCLSSFSDHFGRKKILALGTLGAWVFAVTTGLGVLWGSLTLVLLGRIIQGLFSKTNPIAQAAIGDIAPFEKKIIYMGYLQFAIASGAFIGPIIGGYFARRFLFETFNFSLPYFVALIFALIAFLLTLFYFKETLPEPSKTNNINLAKLSVAGFAQLIKIPSIFALSLLLMFSQLSWSLYYQYIPPLLKTQFHFSATHIGLFVGLIALWLLLATSLGIKLLSHLMKPQHMMSHAIWSVFLGLMITLLANIFPKQLWLLWLGAIPTAAGDVIIYSCITTLYSHFAEKNKQGKVMGICFIIVSTTWAATALLGGFLASFYILLPMIVAPFGILFSAVLLKKTWPTLNKDAA